MILSHYFTTK